MERSGTPLTAGRLPLSDRLLTPDVFGGYRQKRAGVHRAPWLGMVYILKKMKKYNLAVRSTKNDFDQNSALQAACDTAIAIYYIHGLQTT